MTTSTRENSFTSYLINLDGSDMRLASARRQFKDHKLEFERIAAVNGHRLNLNQLADYKPEETEQYMGRQMTGGEIGCVYSHLKALNCFLASGAPYTIIFEDDFLLLGDFTNTLHRTIDWLANNHADWDVVNLSSPARKYSSLRATFGKTELRQAYYFPMLATAFLWSRSGAEAFIAYHQQTLAPYDNIVREWQSRRGKGFSLFPQIVSTIGASSDIDGGNQHRNQNRRSTVLYSIRKQRRSVVLKWRALELMLGKKNVTG